MIKLDSDEARPGTAAFFSAVDDRNPALPTIRHIIPHLPIV